MTSPTRHLPLAGARRPARRLAYRLAIPFVIATTTVVMTMGGPASAAPPTVNLATAGQFSVLGGSTVTNTGPSILHESLGLSPGSSITGFQPVGPGIVLAPGTTHNTDSVADQAQLDLTAAYVDAANRPINATEPSDLVGLTLGPGVYESTAHLAIGLTGELVLDGQGLTDPVFIFQTDSTLITGSSSVVRLINGASECNVFWQVGSSATLGTNSTFVGNIMALTSVTVATGAVVHGRALARNGAVTLDTNTFDAPSCIPVVTPPVSIPTTPTSAPATTAPATTAPATTTPAATTPVTTVAAGTPTTAAGTPTTAPGTPTSQAASGTPSSLVLATIPPGRAGVTTLPFDTTDITLPRTGGSGFGPTSMYGAIALVLGGAALVIARRRRPAV